jgi:hypothetical protein
MPTAWLVGFPGYIGLATVESGSDMGTPGYAAAHIALTESIEHLSPGESRFRALAPGYADEVVFTETKEIAFGCEENRATFSFFRGTKRPKPGPVWLLSTNTTSVSADEVVEIQKAALPAAIRDGEPKELRAWRAGGHVFVSRRAEKSLVSEIWEGEKRLWRVDSEWKPMEGADEVTPDLSGGPGVPIPRMLLRFAGANLLVVQRDGFEGTGFKAYRIENGVVTTSDEGLYLYWCAF